MNDELVFGMPLDSPLSINYDEVAGTVSVTTSAVFSDKSQKRIGCVLTAAAAVELLQALQQIETQSQKPLSAHTKPQTKQ